ncbi:MAG: HypC/HybG/HupF family hydrogenase formation chaperone [Chloroflexota bacterium]|nr:HypC/HybG/HupF family hydrogenase formation chaperone [Chloroflexota bacterium]
MCLVLPARVVSCDEVSADIELHGGLRVSASTELTPDLQPGQYVLVDRGMVLRVIDPEEAEAILAIYAEMADMLEEPADELVFGSVQPQAELVR